MLNNDFVQVTKMGAAERQLMTAIRMYFKKEDPFSIHTLIGASTQILSDLAKKSGINNIFIENDCIRPEMKKEYVHLLRKGKIFLKHADNDPGETFKMKPSLNEYSILEAVVLYERLNNEICSEVFFFRLWFVYNHPSLFQPGVSQYIQNIVMLLTNGTIGLTEMNNFSLITETLEALRGKKYPVKMKNS